MNKTYNLYVVEHGYYDTNNNEQRLGQHEYLSLSHALDFVKQITIDLMKKNEDAWIDLFIEHDCEITSRQMCELLEYDDFSDFCLNNCIQILSTKIKGE